MKRLTIGDFEATWNTRFTDWLRSRYENYDLRLESLTQSERDDLIARVLLELDGNLVAAGPHRLEAWESGWGASGDEYRATESVRSLIPGYFGKYPYVRWQRELYRTPSQVVEYDMLAMLLDWVFESQLDGASALYEFGCGTGHNLIRMRERFPEVPLHGLDWAESSQELIRDYAAKHDGNMYAQRFDYFNPAETLELDPGSKVVTVASLEQIGSGHAAFLAFLMRQPVDLVVHIEPIGELLDESNLLDQLSLRYFRRRGYLKDYLRALEDLERRGLIEILQAQRSFIGSMYIDGYSIIVWRPTNRST